MTTIRKSLANYQIPTIRGTLESLLIWPTAKWWRRCKAYISTDILLIALTFGLWFLVVCKKIKRPGLSYFSSWALAKNLVKIFSLNASLAPPGALAHRLQRRRGQLTLPVHPNYVKSLLMADQKNALSANQNLTSWLEIVHERTMLRSADRKM